MWASTAVLLALPAAAQNKEYKLGPNGQWAGNAAPAAGSDEEVLAHARTLLANGEPKQAKLLLDPWIDANVTTDSPLLVEAFLRRGDAMTAMGEEYLALYDYERVIKNYPESEQFPLAVERELEIGTRYLNGLKKKWLGVRWDDATPAGEELLLRVQERMPGSQLAERAAIELSDYYYRIRDLKMAADSYDIFIKNFPQSEYRQKAMQRRVFANIAKFKGPEYDISGLVEAQFLIQDFAKRYPAEAERIGMNDALVARLDESAGAHMLEIAKWYIIRHDDVSAKHTIRHLFRKHPQTVAARQAEALCKEKGWPVPSAESTELPAASKPADDAGGPKPADAPANPAPTPEKKQ